MHAIMSINFQRVIIMTFARNLVLLEFMNKFTNNNMYITLPSTCIL